MSNSHETTSSPLVDPWVDYPSDVRPESGNRGLNLSILIPLLLLFLAAIPDAMFAPILKQLFVDRFGVTEAAAHLFMAVNVLGVICGIVVMKYLRQALAPMTIVLIAALVEAAMLLLMGLPIGFTATLLVRVIEGGSDLLLIAVPLTLIANQLGKHRKAQGFGIGAMTILIALGIGALIGGAIASPAVFIWGSGLTLVIAFIAAFNRSETTEATTRLGQKVFSSRQLKLSRQAWCGAWLMIGDRGLAALLGTTVPLALANAGVEPMISGIALATCLLIMAFGSWPVGWIADRTSPRQVRIAATTIYAVGFLLLALGPLTAALWLIPTMIIIGVGAAGLMPTAMSLGSHEHARSSEVALMQGASQFGFTAAILAASASLVFFTGPAAYQLILLVAIGVYIAINVAAISTLSQINTTQNALADHETARKPSTVFVFEPCEVSTFTGVSDQMSTSLHDRPNERMVPGLTSGMPMPAQRQ